MNKRIFKDYKRKTKRPPKYIETHKDQEFADHNALEQTLFKFFLENPHFGELRKDGKSTQTQGCSWYYMLDTSGELACSVRIRISDHALGKKRQEEHINLRVVGKDGKKSCPVKTKKYLRRRLEEAIIEQNQFIQNG